MARRGPSRPRPRGAEELSLFGSRLRAPAASPHHLRRPRLLRLLDQATVAPITLVVAPAGSGKTSLLVDWSSVAAIPTVWLSLDESDRDGGQLWNAVAAALSSLVEGPSQDAPSLAGPGLRPEAMVELMTSLEGHHPDSAVLIIDDVDLIDDDDDDVVTSLALFLRSLPSWLHVVLLSRRTPRLPIDRLRARGKLGEVRFAELRFSDQEAEEMLSGLVSFLAEEDVSSAVGRADGWAAGLQLSALAARSEHAQQDALSRVGARDLMFSDYVWHEVLSAESPDVVDVLLDTCVVNRISPPLAAALTGRPDAGELLLEAEARGLFVTRLGASGWLEVHAVLREALLAEATRRSPEAVATRHARAAHWFEETGAVVSALEHWLRAGRPREALRLLARNSTELCDVGREATIARTLAQIPLNVATADVQAMLEFAWCHLPVDRLRFLETVQQAGATVERSGDPGSTQVARLRILQSIGALITGDWVASSELATRAMGELGEPGSSDPMARVGGNMVAREIALSECWDDRSAQLDEVRLACADDPERRLAYEGTRALGTALAGRPVDALRIAAGIRGAVSVNSLTILGAELDIAQAIAHRELGDRPHAVAELASLAEPRIGPTSHTQALALLELTQLRLDEADLEAAEETFELAHEFVRSEFSGVGGLTLLARTGTMVALAAGQIDDARTWSEQVDDGFWGGVGVARVRLVEGRRADAAELLDRVAPRCLRHQVVQDLLRARAAAALPEALECAGRAVERASGAGLLQTVAAEGGEVLELLELHAWMAPKAWLDRLRRAASPRQAAPWSIRVCQEST